MGVGRWKLGVGSFQDISAAKSETFAERARRWKLGVGSWEFEQKIKGFKQRWEFSGDNAAKSETFAERKLEHWRLNLKVSSKDIII